MTEQQESAGGRGRRDAAPRITQGPGVHLRMLRAEARFRNDTRNLQRREREAYSNFLWNMMRLDPGPRVTLHDLVGPNQDSALGVGDDKALDDSVTFYRKKDVERLIEVLQFFTAYLMGQSRREPDPETQRFLLFKALDFARMIVQFSPMSVNAEAESLVLAITIALGTDDSERFGAYMHSEEKIYRLMQRLEISPNDVQTRMDLAAELSRQTSHFDALVHYRMLLRVLVRRGDKVQRSRGYVISRIAEVFGDMTRLSAREIRNGRKLKSFLDRYNRDYAESGHELPRISPTNANQVNRLRRALMGEAARWYIQAAGFPQLDRRVRVRSAMRAGGYLLELGRNRDALKVLEEQYPLWRGIREDEKVLQERADYLRQLSSAAIQSKARDKVNWAARESNEVSNKLGDMDRARKEHEIARAALLGE